MRRALLLSVVALASVPTGAAASSLPTVASGARPGPDALYGKPGTAPQLENTGAWKADPILVSGAQAYRDGEWLYQDFLLDDRGAAGVPDPSNPHGPGDFLFAPTAGTFTYPTDPVYADNAADLVELRIKPLADATLFRVTFNTLKDPERSAVTIALGAPGAASKAWPYNAGVSSPAERFLTWHGAKADLDGTAVPVSVDLARRQIELRVPRSVYDPGRGKVRVLAGTGLWDPAAGTYLAPGEGSATATKPGGASPLGVAIVNAGPRFDEPFPEVSQYGAGWTIADAAAGAAVQAAWWREKAQADALRLGDLSSFGADVDFGKLAAGADDDSGVPKTGPMNRILASRHDLGQGVDHTKVCFDLAAGFSAGAACIGRQLGALQAYALYVPQKPKPAKGYGLTLLLHSLSANYNQYSDSKNQSQLGERGAGTIVATPGGRGPDGFYAGIAEADTFEVWADVARHYDLDPGWAVVSGYSMGGFGTYRLLARFPDLFARGFSVVGTLGAAADQVASMRHTPVLAWNAAGDELVNLQDAEDTAAAMFGAGLRFTYDLFPAADHLTLSTNDEYGLGAAWLGEYRVDRDPPRVTYVIDPAEDSREAGAVGDHAYWLSGLRIRDAKAAKTGTIDVRSDGFGAGDAPVLPRTQSAGVLQGGAHGPMPFGERAQDWGPAPSVPRADRLVVKATNVGAVRIDARRARVTCAPTLDVQSDGPIDVQISCPVARRRAASRAGCTSALVVALPRVRGSRITSVSGSRKGRVVVRARGRNVRRVTLRRPTRKAFALRLTLRTSKGRRVVVTRRYGACR